MQSWRDDKGPIAKTGRVKDEKDAANKGNMRKFVPINLKDHHFLQRKRSQLRNIKLGFLLSVVGLEACSEIYARLPQPMLYGSEPQPITSVSKPGSGVVLIFPGAGGPDIRTKQLAERIANSDKEMGLDRSVLVESPLEPS